MQGHGFGIWPLRHADADADAEADADAQQPGFFLSDRDSGWACAVKHLKRSKKGGSNIKAGEQTGEQKSSKK